MYTVRDYIQTTEGMLTTLARLKDIGYDAVQISGVGTFDADLIKEGLDRLGMRACATHISLGRLQGDLDKVIAEHKTLGIKYVGLGSYKSNTVGEHKDFVSMITPIAQKLYDNGLQFVYHNHHHEFRIMDGVRPMDYYLENTDPKLFGLLPDMYWLQVAGISPTDFVARHADRIKVVHFKDLQLDEDCKPRFAGVFSGNMDYISIYNACINAGVEWAAVEQDICPGDPFDSLRISRDNLRKNGLFGK